MSRFIVIVLDGFGIGAMKEGDQIVVEIENIGRLTNIIDTI